MNNNHSFVIMAHEESAYLDECIQSLLHQSTPSEIIISTSTPNQFLVKVAKKYNLPLKINTQKGLAESWNFALRQCKTKYITLAHQDDVYLPNYTSVMLENLKQHPDFLIKFCDYQEIFHDGDQIKQRNITINLLIKRLLIFLHFGFGDKITKTDAKRKLLRFGSPIPCPSVLYNLERIKNFSFNTSFFINVDWIAWIELASQPGSFVKNSKKLMRHRIHQDSATTRGLRDNQRQSEDLICFSKLWPRKLANLLAKIYTISYMTNSISKQ